MQSPSEEYKTVSSINPDQSKTIHHLREGEKANLRALDKISGFWTKSLGFGQNL